MTFRRRPRVVTLTGPGLCRARALTWAETGTHYWACRQAGLSRRRACWVVSEIRWGGGWVAQDRHELAAQLIVLEVMEHDPLESLDQQLDLLAAALRDGAYRQTL